MFFIDSGDFLNSLLYFGFISVEQNHVFVYFEFREPLGRQKDPISLENNFFKET
jgi:hypothetical protein